MKEVSQDLTEHFTSGVIECHCVDTLPHCCDVHSDHGNLVLAINPVRLVNCTQTGFEVSAIDVCRWVKHDETQTEI